MREIRTTTLNSAGKIPQNERPALRKPQSQAFFCEKTIFFRRFLHVLSIFCLPLHGINETYKAHYAL